ncbi:PLP-dependent aminotransferase family protein [Phenylobacterium aquaticum]|uniref:aminotransferase-like domain-containing protein n=1 Tax=Phenylobacterium aquaticum TaxID=1763816 RepID=UPI001F5D3D79|nr:PLP-dependent aminotransferase family protein [Phenylobacterium aquaticum]MCI3133754.1 PLP-dependent aminotransferase family protein [Phenylobacterium aquaticum]
MPKADLAWTPDLTQATGPLYLALADAIASDLASGALPPGARLPPQRRLAQALGVDFTTISRAYAEAARRGLVEGRVGQGTFARGGAEPPAAAPVDLTMNLPPHFSDPALTSRMWDEAARLRSGGLDLLLRYQDPAGALADREAATTWLAPVLPGLYPDRLLVVPGAQSALFALTSLLLRPGEAVAVERLTFPGYRAAAAQAGVRLIDLAMDAEGLTPEAFEAACRAEAPRLLYCTPTLQNPTTATMSLARRQAIVEIGRRHGVTILEDDAYGRLLAEPLPPLAALAPDITWHVASLAKCLSPGLRIAYLAAPSARAAALARGALRATVSMASPLSAAIASRWINGGCAQAVLEAIRSETHARRALAGELDAHAAPAPDGFHLWLTLPPGWSRGEFAARMTGSGIGVVGSDAFHVGVPPPPEAVRIGLGGPISRPRLAAALQRIGDLLAAAPALSSSVV